MSTKAHDDWVRQTLGVDPAQYQPAKGAPGASAAPAPGAGTPAPAAGVTPPSPPPPAAAPDTLRVPIDNLITAIRIEATKLAAAGIESTPVKTEAAKLQARLEVADKLTDTAKRTAALVALSAEAQSVLMRVIADGNRQETSTGTGITTAIKDMRATAATQINGLDKDNAKKADLVKRLAALDTDITALAKEPAGSAGNAKRKSVNAAAEKLLDDAAAVGAESPNAAVQQKAAAAKQAAYAKALSDRYNFQTVQDGGATQPSFDRVYKMFEKVPVDHVVQDKMKDLKFTKATPSADYKGAEIRMRDEGSDAIGNYINPTTGASEQMNWLNITALHELGHSVDDRYGIMAANMSKTGGGEWKKESQDTVAQAVTTDFMVAGEGRSLGIDAAAVSDFVKKALKGAGTRPDNISDAKWAALDKLAKVCAAMRDGTKPWQSPKSIGGRVYLESYANDWHSCAWSVRSNAQIGVSVYQWRAPGEWFAELYAYSWLNSVAPPTAVDKAIAAYMWSASGDSAGKPQA